ncbi:myosin-binding protein 7-like [Zingiber officinale]|uniref:myosin-binding protein 7-like n=1 Tax=Zingiber officinale TaxID=94328 RepID=UPI001C4AE310|nr:myosin-binding protein 7-like [Zingiber officinale]
MDLDPLSLPGPSAGGHLCPCACPFCCRPASPSFRRSMKRRFESDSADGGGGEVAARVEVENELEALREAVENQQETIQELCAELDEERNAAASAASEAMSMILRLQREKAEAQMDARQFKRFAEEKMEHDQQELLDLEELVFKREEAIEDLILRLQAYRDLLVSHGIDPDDVDATAPCGGDANGDLGASQYEEEIFTSEYPPLKCNLPNDVQGKGDYYDESANLKKFAFRETPHAEEDLESSEHQICELETSPIATDLLEKGVVEEGPGPGPSGHFRSSSFSSYDSIPSVKLQQPLKGEDFPASMDRPSLDDGGADDVSDRVCILDAVHETATESAVENCVDTQRKKCERGEMEGGAPDIRNLYMRLQTLEADRESMRQAIISMRTEKAQLVLLRELAHQLHKDLSPEKKIVKKSSSSTNFSVFAVLKWVMAFLLWRKKPSRTRYTFGSSNANLGLLLLLENSPRISNWRLVTGTQG